MSAGQVLHDGNLGGVLHGLNRDAHFRRCRLEFPVAHDKGETILTVEIIGRHIAQVPAGTGELAVLRQVDHSVRQGGSLDIRPVQLNLHLPVLRGNHRCLQRHRRRVDFLNFNRHLADGLQIAVRYYHVETKHARPLFLGRCPLDGLCGLHQAHALGRSPQ